MSNNRENTEFIVNTRTCIYYKLTVMVHSFQTVKYSDTVASINF